MVTSSWLRWLRSFLRSKGRTYQRPLCRLALEHLETRLAPAAFVWTGANAATNNNWSNGANWSGGVAPQSTDPLDDLVFPSGVTGSALTANDNIVSLTLNSITISGAGYTLKSTANAEVTLGTPSVYNSGYINVGSGLNNEIVSLGSIIMGDASASTGSVQVFTVGVGSTLTISSPLTGSSQTQITKEGGGLLDLTGDNSNFNGPIEIDTNSGAIEITQATGLGTGQITVEQNSQLQLDNITGGSIVGPSELLLNGAGPNNLGALWNIAGTNTWASPIVFDGDTTLGAAAGTTLNIDSVISDTGSGYTLTKEDQGTLVLEQADTYRGGTLINNGVLEITNGQALGATDGSPSTETVVNESSTEAGTLEIDGANGPGGGIAVNNQLLVLNGTGYGTINGTSNPLGALRSVDGNNLWHGNVILGSPAPNGSAVTIDVESGAGEDTSSFTIGVYQGTIGGDTFDDLNSNGYVVSGSQQLTKTGPGTLVFTSNNIYTGGTTIAAGILEIEDSHGLGQPSGASVVDNGATLELAVDNIPDSVTNSVNSLKVSNLVDITGIGEDGVGALYSQSGINIYTGNITLEGIKGQDVTDAIGVDPDPNPKIDRTYITADYHLLVTGAIIGGVNAEANLASNPLSAAITPNPTMAKVDLGDLILENANPNFFGATDIQAGWITIENDDALGGIVSDVGPTIEPPTTVEYGSALTLEPPVVNGVGQSLTLQNRLIIYGTGLSSVNSLFPQLIGANGNGEGALLSLDGQNYITGNLELGGAAGVGAQSIDPDYPTPGELFVQGPVSQVPPTIAVSSKGSGNENETDIIPGNGINVGSALGGTILITADTYPAPDDLRVFVGGNKTTGTLIYDSSTLAYPANAPTSANNVQIKIVYTPTSATLVYANEAFALPDGSGWNQNLVSGAATMNYPTLTSNYIQIVMNEEVNGKGNSDGSKAWTVDVAITPNYTAGSIIKLGSQRVILQGPGTYSGGADIREGVLRIQNSTALGVSGNPGAIVEADTSLEIDDVDATDLAATPTLNNGMTGGLDIWGTPLTIYGTGNNTLLPVTAGAGIDPANLIPVSLDPLINLKGDNAWQSGEITLGSSNINMDVNPNSRLIINGDIGGTASLTFDNSGEVMLGGNNTYDGITYVNEGLLTVDSSTALGTADGTAATGVEVAGGAQIQIAGSINVSDKMLTIQGSGITTQPTIPDSWFAEGPSPITDADTPGGGALDPATGEITGVTADPYDPNVLYVSTAGSGAWKSEDDGQTWQPLFQNVASSTSPNDVAPMFTGAIAVDPLNPNVIFLGTGDGNNATDSYYGTGVYESINGGETWSLLIDPDAVNPNPFIGTSITKIVVDPYDPDSTLNAPVIYVTNSDQDINNSTFGTPTAPGQVGSVGVWRYDLKGYTKPGGSIWFDMTGAVTVNRSTTAEPQTPGPDDDYAIQYPFVDADYSDLAIAYDPPHSPANAQGDTGWGSILYFAVGTDFGYPNLPPYYPQIALGIPTTGLPDNAVYRFPVNQIFYNNLFPLYQPNYGYENPVSFVGGGYISDDPASADYGEVVGVNGGGGNGFPSPITSNDPNNQDNGVIKIALVQYPNPGYVHFIPDQGATELQTDDGEPTGSVFGLVTNPTVAFSDDEGEPGWNLDGDTNAAFEPSNNTYLETGQVYAVFSSVGGGITWKALTAPPIDAQGYQGYFDSTIWATSSTTIFIGGAGTDTYTDDIFESTNDGGAWTDITSSITGPGPGNDAHAMYFDSGNNTLLVGTDTGLWGLGVTDATTGSISGWTNLNGSDTGSDLQATVVTSISGDENNPDDIFIGTQGSGTVESDGTQSWSMVDDENGTTNYGGQVAVDQQNSNIVYAFQSNSQAVPADPNGFFDAANGLGLGVPGELNDSIKSQTVSGGYVDNTYLTTATLQESTTGGASGTWNTIVPNPTLDGVSTNGEDYAQNPPLVLDSVNPERLLIGGQFLNLTVATGEPDAYNDYVFPGPPLNTLEANFAQSVDGGTSWVPFLVPNLNAVTGIAIAEYQGPFVADLSFPLVTDEGANSYDSGTIYVTDGTNLEVTRNDGQNWVERTPNLPTFKGSIASISVDPTNSNIVYLVTSEPTGEGGHIFYSTNAGVKWTDITANLPDVPAWSIAIDPRTETTAAGAPTPNVYIGNDIGVWELPSASQTWNRVGGGNGMPNTQVDSLYLNQNLNTITAGTFGAGVYTYYIDNAVANSGVFSEVSGSSQWSGPVVLNGATTIDALGTQVLQDNIAAAQLNILGEISDAPGTTLNTVTKIGQGTVVLSGANTYSGQTVVQDGVLVSDNPSALPGTSTIVDSGAALELEANLNFEPVTINGNGYLYNGHYSGSLRNISNDDTYTGPLTLASNATIGVDSGTMLTIGGSIGDNGDNYTLTKEEPGTLILAAANTYGGGTDVNQGVLQLQNSQSLGATGQIGNETTVLDGAQLQLFEINNTPVEVTHEILSLSGSGIDGNGALLDESGDNAWDGPIDLDVNPGFSPSTLPTGMVSFGVAAGYTLTLDDPSGVGITDSADANSVYSGIAKVGLGTLILDQADHYRGTTYINQGVIDVQNGQALSTKADNQERQRVTVTSTSTNGTFTLSFEGKSTAALAYDSTAAQVTAALLSPQVGTIPAGDVSVTRNVTSFVTSSGTVETYYVYTVEFLNAFGLQNDLPLLVATGTSGADAAVSLIQTGNIGTLVSATTALQVDGDPTNIGNGTGITVAGQNLGINGTGVNGAGAVNNVSGTNVWTGAVILLDTTSTSSAAVVDSMGSSGASSLSISGNVQDPTPLTTTAATLTKVGTGTIIFPNANTYGGDTVVANGDLAIENPTSLGLRLPEIQLVSSFGTNGTYTLTYGGATTAPIAYDATALAMQTALDNAILTLNPNYTNAVTVSLAANVYTVKFTGTFLTGQNLQQLTAGNFVNGASASVATYANGTGGTTVNSTSSASGTLQIDGDPQSIGASIAISDENLFLNGNGYNNAGALENVSGNNTWLYSAATPSEITLQTSSSIGVDNSTTLTDNQQIVDGGDGLGVTKVGTGTLDLDGGAGFSNTYTGLTQVDAGRLQLDMTGGATPFLGNLTIGQPAPAAGTAVVEWLNNNQIASETPDETVSGEPVVTVDATGTMNLNGYTDTVPTLDFTDGQATTGTNGQLTADSLNMTGGTITLATAGSTLFLAGNVTATSDLNQTATITGAGTLSLDDATRVFDVASSGLQASDLEIQSPIINSGSGGLVKTGNGILQLTNNDAFTFTGLSTVEQGSLQVDGTLDEVDLAGGTISGTGTVYSVDNGAGGSPSGTIQPGDTGSGTPTGILTIDPSVNQVWSPATTLFVDLIDSADPPGVGFDELLVDGNVNLGGAKINGFVGANVNIGDSFTVLQTLDGGTITGQFAAPFSPNVAFIDGQKFAVFYTNSANNPSDPITEVVLTRMKDTLTSFTVTSSNNPTVYGQDFSFTAALTPEPGAGAVPTSDSVTFSLQIAPSSFITETVNVTYPTGDTTIGYAYFDPQAYSGIVLDPGTYPLTVTYNGDNNFNASTTTLTGGQVVDQAESVIALSSSPANPVVGQTVTISTAITARAPGIGTPQGTVTFTVDGNTGSPITLNSSGDATLQLPNLGAGTHLIDLTYSGDLDFQGSSTSSDYIVTVAKDADTLTFGASPSTSVSGQLVTFTAQVASAGPDEDVPTGTITFYNGALPGGTLLGIEGLDGTGSASLSTAGLSVGSHVITAVYSGDTEYLSNNTTISPFVVSPDPTSTTLSSTVNPSTYGNSVTFTATVATVAPASGTATGTVQFVIDGANYGSAVSLNSLGQATLTLSNLSIKSHSIVADYLGNSAGTDATSNSGTLTQVVRSATTTTVTSSEAPSSFGDTVTFTATIAPVSPGSGVPNDGTVQFVIDGVDFGAAQNVSGGKATISLNNLSILPTHSIIAQYSGDPTSYAPSNSSPLTQIVRSGTTVTVASSANPSVYGSAVTFTATVGAGAVSGDSAPTGGGTVTFIVDGTAQTPVNLPASDKVTLTLTSLGLGAHTIVADYSGTTTSFSPSSGSVSQQVDYNSTASLTSSANPAILGSTVTFTATISPVSPASITPTGSVVFTVNGTPSSPVPLSGGSATFTPSNLIFGANTVVATYSGDSNYVPSTSQITQDVVYASTTTLASSAPASAVWGQPVTISATVAAAGSVPTGTPAPTGSVIFSVDGFAAAPVTLVGGVAVFTLPTENVGTYSITAAYSGDANYGMSNQASVLSQQINVGSTTVTITSSANPAGTAQPVIFTATVSSVSPGIATPTGTVTFVIDGTAQNPEVLNGNGQATFTVGTLPMGPNTIVVNYSGSSNSNASNDTFTQNELFGSSTSLTSTLDPSVFGQSVSFIATVANTSGVGTPTGKVQFVVDGQNAGSPVSLNAFDQATYTLSTLAIGPHQVVADYSGDNTFATSSSSTLSQTVLSATTTALSSSSLTAVYGQPETIQATVIPQLPGSGTPTQGSVTFFVNGVAQQPAAALNSSGVATLNLNTLAAGNYTISATYSGDSVSYAGSTSNSITESITADGTTTVVTSSANPAGASQSTPQSVTFTATVSPDAPGAATPTGSVSFVVGSTVTPAVALINGTATYTRTFSTTGTVLVIANYTPNPASNFTQSSGTLSESILNATTTTLKSSANPAVPGSTVTFTATVKPTTSGGTPTGTVSFYIDGTLQTSVPLSAGAASLKLSTSLAALSVGSHEIAAVYNPISGDNFAGSTASLVQLIHYTATAGVKTSLDPSPSGQAVTFTATITPKSPAVISPTGTVTFYISGKAVATLGVVESGSGSGPVTVQYTTSTLSVGNHAVYVVYNGDNNFGTATSVAIAQIVQPIATRIAAAVSPNATDVGVNTPFSVTVVAYNAQNQVATKFTNQPVTIDYTYLSAGGGGTIGGTLTGTMINGRITLSGLFATKVGSYTLEIFAGNLETTLSINTSGRRT